MVGPMTAQERCTPIWRTKGDWITAWRAHTVFSVEPIGFEQSAKGKLAVQWDLAEPNTIRNIIGIRPRVKRSALTFHIIKGCSNYVIYQPRSHICLIHTVHRQSIRQSILVYVLPGRGGIAHSRKRCAHESNQRPNLITWEELIPLIEEDEYSNYTLWLYEYPSLVYGSSSSQSTKYRWISGVRADRRLGALALGANVVRMPPHEC